MQVRVVPDEVHVTELKVPDAELPKLTVPVGRIMVPLLGSVTMAVQVVAVLIAVEVGEQETVVDVDRRITLKSKLIVELGA